MLILSKRNFCYYFRFLDEGKLNEYGVEALSDKKRVMNMIQGEESVKANFALQTRPQARTILNQFLADTKDVEEILNLIGEEKVTGFQLVDVFDETKNFNEIKQKLHHKILSNEAILRGIRKEEDDEVKEKEEVADKKKGDFPPDDIEKILKTLGLGDSIPKLKEHEINTPAVFWNIEVDKIITVLDVKTEGKKFRLIELIK